jgi:hypothetical protein
MKNVIDHHRLKLTLLFVLRILMIEPAHGLGCNKHAHELQHDPLYGVAQFRQYHL